MLSRVELDALGSYAKVVIDRRIYGDTPIFKTAYWFTDRFYVFLGPADEHSLTVELRRKSSEPVDLASACGAFCNALIDYRVRDIINGETKGIREAIVTKAFMEGIPLQQQTE